MARKIELNIGEMSVTLVEHTGSWNGKDYILIKSATYMMCDLPSQVQDMCALHGLAQKLCDQTSSMSAANGYIAADRFDVIGELFKQLESGHWKKPSSGGGGKLNQAQIKNKMSELGLTDEQYATAVKLGLIKA